MDFKKFMERTPEEQAQALRNMDAKFAAEKARTKLMVDKLYDQMSRGCIDNDWAENFIESVHAQVRVGVVPLSSKQLAKLEELFERY